MTQPVAVVTGASSGIGEATARALVDAGYVVAAGARRQDRLHALIAEVDRHGGQAISVRCDVRREEDVTALVRTAEEHFGRIDVIVNAAGVAMHGPLGSGRTDEWRTVVETNLLGVLYGIAAVAPRFEEQGHGHVVNVSSAAGRRTLPLRGVYSASKHGVEAVSEALRQEWMHSPLRVTVVQPGYVATEFSTHTTDPVAIAARAQLEIPPDVLAASDVADAIAWAVENPQLRINELFLGPY